MTIESTSDREQLLDELARCFMRAAFNSFLAEQRNAAEPEEQRRPISDVATEGL